MGRGGEEKERKGSREFVLWPRNKKRKLGAYG